MQNFEYSHITTENLYCCAGLLSVSVCDCGCT